MTLARTLAPLLSLGLLLGCASPGGVASRAAEREQDRLQRRFSAAEIVALLREDGYGSVEPIGREAVRFKAEGMSYVITIYDDGDLQLYFGLTGISVPPAAVNEWNRTRRLTRAYLDDQRDPVLESDLLSDAGISQAMLLRWVQVFVQGAGLYHDYLLDHGTLEPVPARAQPASI